MPSRSVLASLIGLAALTAGCTKDPEYEECIGDRPAFLVRVSARAESLPDDTRLKVQYGAGEEEYLLEQPPDAPEVVFCTLLSRQVDAGSMIEVEAGAPVQELLCELWTQGAATLTVRATGYPAQELNLRAERNECGIETVDYHVVLERADAGG
ncbi:MAG TPA: hypothetical protein VI072_07405 [Polyangiaceae bacterium]